MSAGYLLQRLVQTLLTVVCLSVVVFGLARLSGDPVSIMAPAEASPEILAQMRADLGLDRPLPVQYWRFVSAASVGDFGESVKWNQPAAGIVLDRFPATLLLSATAMAFGLLLALPIGILSAKLRGSWVDSLGKLVALVGQSMPTFWFGILLILVFAIYIPILPTSGYGSLDNLVLPSITLGSFVAASIMRVTRSAMIDSLQTDYVRTARSKGLSEWRVVLVHAFKNAAAPIVTITALEAANILRGAVVTETIFAWPGVGKIAVDAVYSRDFPLVQASVMLMGTVFLVTNLAVDILHALLDPRIRHGRAA
jgi:peptide/nickel transport system permease protein